MSTSPGTLVLWAPPPHSPQDTLRSPAASRAPSQSPTALSPWFAAVTGYADPISPLNLASPPPHAVASPPDHEAMDVDEVGCADGGSDKIGEMREDSRTRREGTNGDIELTYGVPSHARAHHNASPALPRSLSPPITSIPSIFGTVDLTHLRINTHYLALVRALPLTAALPVPFVYRAAQPVNPPAILEEDIEMAAEEEDDGLVSSLPPLDLDPEPELESQPEPQPEKEATQNPPERQTPEYLRPEWPAVVEPEPEIPEEDEWMPRRRVGRFVIPGSQPEEPFGVPITSVPGLVNLIHQRTVPPAAASAVTAPVVAPSGPTPVAVSASTPALGTATQIGATMPAPQPATTPMQPVVTPVAPVAPIAPVTPSRPTQPVRIPTPEPEAPDEPQTAREPSPEIRPKNVIPNRKITLAKKSPPHDDADEQWRVGKTPGHQGSHVRVKRNADDDEKYDSTKVLKRPFRPPTRIAAVSVNEVKHVAVPSSPPSEASVPSSPPSKSSTASSSTASSSTASSSTATPTSTSSRSARKPFRALTRSAAPSPSSRRTSVGKLRLKNIDPDAELIAALENRVRTLKAAVKYVSSEDEDARLARLVRTWREAGRDVADRLFALLPEPAPDASATSFGGSWGWGWDDDVEKTEPEPLSREAVQFFLDAPTNARGESVNDDGVPLLGEGPDLDDVFGTERAAKRQRVERELEDYGVPPDEKATPPQWDRGAMLLRLGVDPALLGFDADADDWEDIDDE